MVGMGKRALVLCSSGPQGGFNLKPWFCLQVDHFGFSVPDKFSLRYLVADQFWAPEHGPIFLYTGNEGDIELFCNNTVRHASVLYT